MRGATPWLALLGALSAGCTPADLGPTDAGGGDGPTNLVQAAQDRAYAYCARLQFCSPTAVQLRFGTLQTCQSILSALYGAEVVLPQSGVTISSLEACTAAIGSSMTSGWNCEDIINNVSAPPECTGFAGPRAMGAPCAVGAQCQSSFCAAAPGAGCGACAPVPQQNAQCATQSCGQGDLVCTTAQTCVPYAGMGQQCSAGTQPCGAGLTCVGAVGTTPGECAAATQVMLDACLFTMAGCDIFSGLACNASTGVCETARIANPGEACGVVGFQPATCAVGDCIRGVCVGRVPFGGSCNLDGGPPCMDSTRCVIADGGAEGTCEVLGMATCP